MLGDLEDLSIADLIQIIHLSRRTGVLAIDETGGLSTLLFSDGLIVNGSSPSDPDLATHLRNVYLGEDAMPFLRMQADQGKPAGSAVLDLGLMNDEELRNAIKDRLRRIVTPLMTAQKGKFTFTLSEAIAPVEVGYDPRALFGEAGIPPHKLILAESDSEKVKPLRGLAETVQAARALRRPPGTEKPPSPSFEPMDPAPIDKAPFESGEIEPQDDSLESLLSTRDIEGGSEGATVEAMEPAKFRVGSASSEVAETIQRERRLVVLQPDPLVRVAIRRSFGRRGVTTLHFSAAEEATREIHALVKQNQFFVTVLDVNPPEQSLPVLNYVKRTNRRLPVLVVYREADGPLRRKFADGGADVFVKKPPDEVLKSPAAQTELDIFCGELLDIFEKANQSWDQLSAGLGSEEQRGAEFYGMAEREKAGRTMGLLRQLINELTGPGDVSQLAQTILRLSSEYLDRAILFVADSDAFVSVGSTITTADPFRISRTQPSVLRDVTESRKPHRGKLKRESANEQLLSALGKTLPTEALVVPVMNEDEVIGVLYGDNATHRAPIGNTSGLEIFLSQAGFALHNALAGTS